MQNKPPIFSRFSSLFSSSKQAGGAFARSWTQSVLLCATLLFGVTSQAQENPVTTTSDTSQALIGDPIKISVAVPYFKGLKVEFIEIDTLLKNLEIVKSAIDTLAQNDGNQFIRKNYIVTSFEDGPVSFPPVIVVAGQDTLVSDLKLLYFHDLEIDPQADIKEIKAPLEPPFDWLSLWPWLLGCALLGIVIPLLYHYFKKRGKQPEVALPSAPAEPAHITALARLEALRQQKLWQNDRAKEYHIELTDILRWYLEQRFGIMALEQTTDEIIGSMERSGIDRALIADMRKVLVLADLVKFAKANPISTENEQSMDHVVAFVKATIPAPTTEVKA